MKKENNTYKCPECGQEATDEQFMDGTAMLDFMIDGNGKWHWECFNCNHNWATKGKT